MGNRGRYHISILSFLEIFATREILDDDYDIIMKISILSFLEIFATGEVQVVKHSKPMKFQSFLLWKFLQRNSYDFRNRPFKTVSILSFMEIFATEFKTGDTLKYWRFQSFLLWKFLQPNYYPK